MKTPKNLHPLDSHAGFVAPRYKRAGHTADALLRAGRQLLRKRPLENMTIQDVCTRAHVTTGAFYGRFQGKEVFFKALQAIAADEIHQQMLQRLEALAQGDWELYAGIHMLLRKLRRLVIRHEGVLRATMIQVNDRAGWDVFKQQRHAFVEQVLPLVEAMHGGPSSELLRRRIRFAFQMTVGTILNVTLNNPGPVLLSSHELDDELALAFCAYLDAAPRP